MTGWFGEGIALLTAGCWAVCSLAFAVAGRRVDATTVNLVRILIAFAVLGSLHVLQFGSIWPDASDRQIQLLLASGFVGLALGDQCLFHCLARLGPRIGSLLMALSPAMTAVLGWIFLDERLSATGVWGIVITTVGVIAVVTDRRGHERWHTGEDSLPAAVRSVALLCGVLGALGQASGLVLGKLAIRGVAAGGDDLGELPLDPFSGTVVRMTAGAVGVLAIALVSRRGFAVRDLIRDRRAGVAMIIGTLSGPILGVWLSLVAVQHADVGIAATLMALTPVLMIPISRFAYGAQPGPRAIVGTIVAVSGAAMLFR